MTRNAESILTAGVDVFTLLDLIQKAAAYKNLKLHECASRAYSEPIKVYALDDKLLGILAEQGIKKQVHSDCREEIFTLVDENLQEKVSRWAPSNYWNFERLKGESHKFDLRIALCVGFELNIRKRGVVFWPRTSGSLFFAADKLPNFRMFKTLVESDDDAPAIAKELAVSDGSIVVGWTTIGLGGIRRMSDLFMEFVGRNNERVMQFGSNSEVFDPVPYPRYLKPGDELFVAEPAQPRVLETWREQLGAYRDSLVVF